MENKKSDEIIKLKPHGVFLSNGPGDPAATSEFANKTIRSQKLIRKIQNPIAKAWIKKELELRKK